jgi:hypothetical protein
VSSNNLNSASKTLVHRIWQGIKDDKELKHIIASEKQITHNLRADIKNKKAHIAVFLYNITELSILRNQPQITKPPTLLNLKLHYLIVPLTDAVLTNQLLLEKIIQIFAEKPILRGSDLQGSLHGDSEVKVTLEQLSIDELGRVWHLLGVPFRLAVSYSVYPIAIKPDVKQKKPRSTIQKKGLQPKLNATKNSPIQS